ncbi:MAG: DUF2064 domain-containing protein [Actinomycetota bacterium]|nr:DUF2064 domain-containing protein [Actinomycetota bacterium]
MSVQLSRTRRRRRGPGPDPSPGAQDLIRVSGGLTAAGLDLTIAVIAKECLPGKVKTRLTPPLTAGEAARLAQVSLTQTLRTVRDLPVSRRLLVIDGTPLPADAAGFEIHPQAEGGLDERLAAVCAPTNAPLLILGMDTPQLVPALLRPLLEDWSRPKPRFGAWLGLAHDGGFWALALRQPEGNLIRGVPMSTADTGSAQGARLEQAGLAVGLLPALTDVDTFAAATEVALECPGTPFARTVRDLAGFRPPSGFGSAREVSK